MTTNLQLFKLACKKAKNNIILHNKVRIKNNKLKY